MPGMRVVFFSVVPQTDAAGRPVGINTNKIGEGLISAVMGATSSVQVTESQALPQASDLVITK